MGDDSPDSVWIFLFLLIGFMLRDWGEDDIKKLEGDTSDT